MINQKIILTAVLAAVIALYVQSGGMTADLPGAPPPSAAPFSGPATVPAMGCLTCGAAAGTNTSDCKSCGTSWFKKHTKGPYVVNLCPGACFGYFQTQWRKWDDVCPYPYQGVGVSDAPRPPAPVLPGVPKPGLTIPSPRPVETKPSDIKPMSLNTLPSIPLPPSYGKVAGSTYAN